jgi:pimeloyl-ACP methyl ester carboxylesterase
MEKSISYLKRKENKPMNAIPKTMPAAQRSRAMAAIFRLAAACVLLLTLAIPATARAATDSNPWPGEPFCQEGSLAAPDAQLTLVCLPVGIHWNGTLIVYAHGFVPPQVPLALPAGELSQITLPTGQSFVELLLSQGFAFATSSYSKNGYAVQQAEADINALVDSFKSAHPELKKVLMVGASEGGLITVELIERDWQVYSGGLALCGPIGGALYQVKYLGDFRVVFDYFFPHVFPFGVKNVPEDAWQIWDSNPNGISYTDAIIAALGSNPANTTQLFKVTRAALDAADPAGSAISTALQALYYSIWETPDTIATAGGNPYGNRVTLYFGSANDRLLNRGVERVSANPAAIQYMLNFYQTTGNLRRPLVTLHTTQDPQVPFQHELIYLGLALSKGKLGYLTQLPVARYGHCNFTPQEALGAFELLLLKTGLSAPALKPFQNVLPQPYVQK